MGRAADHVLFGSVALREVPAHQAADGRPVVTVERLFAGGLDDPQVDVRVVGLPGHHDPHVDVQELDQPRVERDVRDAGGLRLGDDAIDLFQGNDLDLREPRVPASEDQPHEQIDGPAVVVADGIRRARAVLGCRFGSPGKRQRQIAERLRLLGPQFEDLLKRLHGQVQLSDLEQAMPQHAKQGRLLQL